MPDDMERLFEGLDDGDDPTPDFETSLRARLDEEMIARQRAAGDSDDEGDLALVELPGAHGSRGWGRSGWVRAAAGVAAAAAVIVGVVTITDDGDDGTQVVTEGPESAAECVSSLELTTPGALTVGTITDRRAPWAIGDPTEQSGFVHALTYELAGRLGFADDEVTWVIEDFGDEAAGTALASPARQGVPWEYDVFVDLTSITDEREQALDVSDSYYDVELALVAFDDSPLTDATSVADLEGVTLAAITNTSSLVPGVAVDYARSVVGSQGDVVVFDSRESGLVDIVGTLSNGTADALVVDYPSDRYLTASFDPPLEDVSVVAVAPRAEPPFEEYGLLLEDDSPLTRCVNLALGELRRDGTLEALETEWLREGGTIPTLTE